MTEASEKSHTPHPSPRTHGKLRAEVGEISEVSLSQVVSKSLSGPCKSSHALFGNSIWEGRCGGGQHGRPQRVRMEQGLRRGPHISALSPLQGLQRSAPSCLHHLFLCLIRESQELNPQGFGCLGHRNATWVKCLRPAL